MINTLISDAASSDRNNVKFPFLRNFSPYAGHSWANGFASFPQGNDPESTSESMQFASSLIHWVTITEIEANTVVLNNQEHPNLWYDRYGNIYQ